MMKCARRPRSLRNSCKGSVYIELAASVLLMFTIFFGIAITGSSIIDMDRDGRAARAGVDLAWVLDDRGIPPSQADFDRIGTQLVEVMSVEAGESFRVILTAIEFDHTGAGLSVDWQGASGPATGVSSKIDISGGQVIIEGAGFTVADDERMIAVEIFRARRGLFPGPSPDFYTRSLVYRPDPNHA